MGLLYDLNTSSDDLLDLMGEEGLYKLILGLCSCVLNSENKTLNEDVELLT